MEGVSYVDAAAVPADETAETPKVTSEVGVPWDDVTPQASTMHGSDESGAGFENDAQKAAGREVQ
jgi:hypothetical protein